MADEAAEATGWHYLGVGCLTAVAGFFGGGMLGVMVAKIAGAFTRCTPDAETGAPCNWFVYAVCGALIGLVVLPSVAIFRLRSARQRGAPDHSQRG